MLSCGVSLTQDYVSGPFPNTPRTSNFGTMHSSSNGNAPAAGYFTRGVHAVAVTLALGFLSASYQLAPSAAHPVQARPERCALEAVSEKRAVALCTKTLRRAARINAPHEEATLPDLRRAAIVSAERLS